jgi:hypothetical protein
MAAPTLEQWSALVQIVVGLTTSVGVIVSLCISVRAIREVQKDRHLRQKPYLAFQGGGCRVPVRFVKAAYYVPGMNPAFAKRAFSHLPADAESVRIDSQRFAKRKEEFGRIGHLRNFGLGPAIETRVIWLAQTVVIGDQTFEIDERKRSEPRYSIDFNSLPANPEHIGPEGEAGLTRLPTFIEKDCEKHIKQVEGVLLIQCEDVFGNTHETTQSFWMETHYASDDGGPYIHVTFRDVVHTEGEKAETPDPLTIPQ